MLEFAAALIDEESGQGTNANPIQRQEHGEDRNGRRDGAWKPRLGLSRLVGGTTADSPISAIMCATGKDGRRWITCQQENGSWVAVESPALVW